MTPLTHDEIRAIWGDLENQHVPDSCAEIITLEGSCDCIALDLRRAMYSIIVAEAMREKAKWHQRHSRDDGAMCLAYECTRGECDSRHVWTDSDWVHQTAVDIIGDAAKEIGGDAT